MSHNGIISHLYRGFGLHNSFIHNFFSTCYQHSYNSPTSFIQVRCYFNTTFKQVSTRYANTCTISIKLYRKKDHYVHIVIHNVGCGAALATEISIQKAGDVEHTKSLYTRDLRPEADQTHIHLYIDANVPTDDKYEIIVTYSNLYGKKYQQRYPFDKEFIALQSERTTLSEE